MKYTYEEVSTKGEELFYAEDPNADYNFDDIVLYKYKRRYVLFFDSGCSCDAPFAYKDIDLGDDYTKAELKRVAAAWGDRSSEGVMKEWIKENL